jgi:alkylation response protein AidB-like acyl-CoA dehydrogenase
MDALSRHKSWVRDVAMLAPTIAVHADAAEAERTLPRPLVEALAGAGLFRMLVPRSAGGLEVTPSDMFHAIAAVAVADASAGWCVMIGATSGLLAAYLPEDVAGLMFADPLVVTGGVFAPMGKAERVGGDYVVNGHWRWASGSRHCRWLAGGCVVTENGVPVTSVAGVPDARMILMPAGAVTLEDTWHTAGLKGTGSGDMRAANVRVSQSNAVSLTRDTPRERGPLYAFPLFGLLAIGISAVAAGTARAAIADFTAIATEKVPMGGTRRLADRATVQVETAQATARLSAAIAWVEKELAAGEIEAQAGAISLGQRAALRLAATHLTRTAAEVTRTMHDLAGGTAAFLSCPLQRRLRDVQTMTGHVMIAPQTYELTGRALLGLPLDATML